MTTIKRTVKTFYSVVADTPEHVHCKQYIQTTASCCGYPAYCGAIKPGSDKTVRTRIILTF